jgi:hypothetical protein
MLNPHSNISLRKRLLFGGWSAVASEYEDEEMYPCASMAAEQYRSASTEFDLTAENTGDPVNCEEYYGM